MSDELTTLKSELRERTDLLFSYALEAKGLEAQLAELKADMQALVVKLTALADEFQTEETWDGKRDDALRYCARRLREAIMRSQGSKSRAQRGGER